jgi:hypothetical protein
MQNCEIGDKSLRAQCLKIGDGCALHNLIIGQQNAASYANRFGKQRGAERFRSQKQKLQNSGGCRQKDRVELLHDSLGATIDRMP